MKVAQGQAVPSHQHLLLPMMVVIRAMHPSKVPNRAEKVVVVVVALVDEPEWKIWRK